MTEPNKQPYQYTAGDIARYASGEMSREDMHRLEKAALDDPFLAEALEGIMVSGGQEAWKDLGELKEQLSWKLNQRAPESSTSPLDQHQPGKTGDESNAPDGGMVVPAYPGRPSIGADDGEVHISKKKEQDGGATLRRPWFSRGYRVAAAVALLIGLGVLTNWFVRQASEPAPSIVKTETPSGEPSGSAHSSSSSMMAAADSVAMNDTAKQDELITALASADIPEKPATADRMVKAAPEAKTSASEQKAKPEARNAPSGYTKSKEQPIQSERTDPPIAAATPIARPPATQPVNAESDKAFMGKARTAVPPGRQADMVSGPFVFSGDIVDQEGKPLSFVNIRMESGNGTYYSDAKGHFRILSADTSLRLVFKAYGFQSKPLSLQARGGATRVQLVPGKDIAKAKTALKPKASSREEMETLDTEDDSTEQFIPAAEPRDGWGAYQFYLLNNLRMPQDAVRTKLHGTVDISFLVDPNGRLSDFRVEKSLSPSCDKEAIRLVREGPAWDLFNSETALRGRVTVVF